MESRDAISVNVDPIDRKVRRFLDKLTRENFDCISDQIVWWTNQKEKEKDGRTLFHVTPSVFEKAIDEAALSERLCRKIMEEISNEVQDYGIKNMKGEQTGGGHCCLGSIF